MKPYRIIERVEQLASGPRYTVTVLTGDRAADVTVSTNGRNVQARTRKLK